MDILDQLSELAKPTVEQKVWMKGKEFILAGPEMLDRIAEECIAAGHYGLDLETSGLDQRAFPTDQGTLETVDKIVGMCLAPTVDRGYYVPMRHKEKGAEANVPPRLAVAMINKIQAGGAIAVFHNAKFDQKFLQYEPAGEAGKWDDPKSWEDTWILAYLRNSRQRQKGLKYLSKEDLGREMIELADLFLKEKGKKIRKDFSLLDPTWEPVVWYAAADAMNTLSLFLLLHPVVVNKDKFGNSQRTIYTVEKIANTATRWMEQCRIHIDRAKLIELIQLGQKEWWECINIVYTDVSKALSRDVRPGWVREMEKIFDPAVIEPGYMEVREGAQRSTKHEALSTLPKSVPSLVDPKVRETVPFLAEYDITVPAQLGMLLREVGVRGLVPTEKSGQVKTSKDVLDAVVEKAGDQFPWMKNVKRFREISKSLGTTLCNIYQDSSPERAPDGCVWANFNGLKTDTGRFSTPTPSDKNDFHGQVNWNVQSTTATYDKSKPECARRQRECISARPGYVLFAIDYSGVELRIATNLSGEPKWLAEFFHCSGCDHEFERGVLPPPFCPHCGSDKIGDLHTLTALGIYGSVDKQKRQVGKIVNFLLCYGGSGNAVQRSTGCDKEEGWRIKNQFDKTYRTLGRWWKLQHQLAKKQKYVSTAFGRKYPVPDIDHEFGMFRSKAERNSVNGPVQGSSADIIKLAMGLLYREFKKRGWIDRGQGLPDLVMMTITIHDELVFEIHESVVGEAIPVIEHIMCVDTVKNLGWMIPLKVDIEFGPDWTVKNNLTEMAHNKGGGAWTAEYAAMFSTYYSLYLECGGTPVAENGVAVPAPLTPQPNLPAETVTSDKPSDTPPPKMLTGEQAGIEPVHAETYERKIRPAEKDGEKFVYRVPTHLLTPGNAEHLAEVIAYCKGKGTDLLVVQDEHGNDLLGGAVKVAVGEFRTLAAFRGL